MVFHNHWSDGRLQRLQGIVGCTPTNITPMGKSLCKPLDFKNCEQNHLPLRCTNTGDRRGAPKYQGPSALLVAAKASASLICCATQRCKKVIWLPSSRESWWIGCEEKDGLVDGCCPYDVCFIGFFLGKTWEVLFQKQYVRLDGRRMMTHGCYGYDHPLKRWTHSILNLGLGNHASSTFNLRKITTCDDVTCT